ncbi:MAG: hypothetical protein ACI91O_000693 [Candidatus Poriferisodalaceae bacterium]|jgi:hypothetical protein
MAGIGQNGKRFVVALVALLAMGASFAAVPASAKSDVDTTMSFDEELTARQRRGNTCRYQAEFAVAAVIAGENTTGTVEAR